MQNITVLITIATGGTKIAYDIFRSSGITSCWLDELLAAGSDITPTQ
ncbi:MAG: hypothetical protein HGA39_04055 [Coriobacteriia bacterium]|nr:hypothetical protein [Coriobacteriia bacterium]